MYCSNCGKQIIDGAKFCPFCGKEVIGTNASDNQLYNNSPKNGDRDIQVKKSPATREIIIMPYDSQLSLEVLRDNLAVKIPYCEMAMQNILGIRFLKINKATKFAKVSVKIYNEPSKGRTRIVLTGEITATGFVAMGPLAIVNLFSSEKLDEALNLITDSIKQILKEI